jgi:hypothetical protein
LFKLFSRKKDQSVQSGNLDLSIDMKTQEGAQPDASAAAEDMDELIAVITAAVAASLNRSTHNIIVRSVKRVPTVSPAWNRAARLDLTTPKLY